jgi:hypothetical protein
VERGGKQAVWTSGTPIATLDAAESRAIALDQRRHPRVNAPRLSRARDAARSDRDKREAFTLASQMRDREIANLHAVPRLRSDIKMSQRARDDRINLKRSPCR